ncbi:GGDEF family protein [Vibrio ponticus]|nr:GGDEF family protein [Vibrio ponticus]
MEAFLNKISDAGLDASSVAGEEALIFWRHVRKHVATTPQEKAQSLVISAEFRTSLKQFPESISELRAALELLTLPQDAEHILEVRSYLADRLVDQGDFAAALNEYVAASSIAVEASKIDAYVKAVIGMGNLCDAYGDHARALRYYQKIDSIDHAISSRSLRLRYKLYKLACLIDLRRTKSAKELISECEELSILVSDKS